MANNSVSLEVQVEINKAVQSLSTFSQQAKESLEKVSSQFSALKVAGVAAVAALIVEAVSSLKEFAVESVNAAAKQEDGYNRLATALALTGEYSDKALEDLKKFADQMEESTRFGDDLVISQLAIAKSFGLSNEASKQLVSAASDLATATGTTLNEAVEKLGKTYSGNAGRLAQQIPGLENLTEAQLRAGEAVKLVGERFRGSATADINTYSGAVLQSGNAFENFQKSLGSVVTESPVVIARIKGLTTFYAGLEKVVQDNKETLESFLNFGIKAIAVAVPVATDIIFYTVQVFEALAGAVVLAASGLAQIVGFVSQGLIVTFRGGANAIFDLVESVLTISKAVPGVSEALESVGFETDKVAESLDAAKKGFNTFSDEAVESVDNAVAGVFEFAVATGESFEKFDVVLAGVREAVDKSAQAIFDADETVVKSGEKAASGRTASAARVKSFVKDITKDLEEFAKFQADALTLGFDQNKLQAELDASLEKIQKFEDDRIASSKEAEELRIAVIQTFTDKTLKLQEDAAKKLADETRRSIEDAASQPIVFAIKAGIDDLDIADDLRSTYSKATNEGIAGGIGLLSDALDGASGARSLISSASGAFADAFIPGIGGAVGSVVSKLAEGPEATKQFIREFINSIPDIMDAVAEAIPAVVEALVDTLVNKGGAARIGFAIARAMAGEGVLKSAGKQLGLSAGDSFNAQNIGQTFGQGAAKSLSYLESIGPRITSGLQNGLTQMIETLNAAPDRIRSGFTEAPAQITRGFSEGSASAVASLTQVFASFTSGLNNIAAYFAALGERVIAGISQILSGFGDLSKAIAGSVANLFNFKFPPLPTFSFPALPSFKFPALPAFPAIPTPAWLNDFTSAVKSLTGGNFAGIGGGGGGGGVIGRVLGSVPGFATGISEIPSGFPNDSYLAGLSSSERVVEAPANRSLNKFLAAYEDGALNLDVVAMLARLTELLAQPITVATTAKVDQRAFADIILRLDRTNQRLRA